MGRGLGPRVTVRAASDPLSLTLIVEVHALARRGPPSLRRQRADDSEDSVASTGRGMVTRNMDVVRNHTDSTAKVREIGLHMSSAFCLKYSASGSKPQTSERICLSEVVPL